MARIRLSAGGRKNAGAKGVGGSKKTRVRYNGPTKNYPTKPFVWGYRQLLCRRWMETRICDRRATCQYAHGLAEQLNADFRELKMHFPRTPYKQTRCPKNPMSVLSCEKAKNCWYYHDDEVHSDPCPKEDHGEHCAAKSFGCPYSHISVAAVEHPVYRLRGD